MPKRAGSNGDMVTTPASRVFKTAPNSWLAPMSLSISQRERGRSPSASTLLVRLRQNVATSFACGTTRPQPTSATPSSQRGERGRTRGSVVGADDSTAW
jgi:hypothetical protein